jgi:hypothetical protein
LCVGLTGCLPLTLPTDWEAYAQLAENRRCRDSLVTGITVSEPLDVTIPTDEGTVEIFGPTFWRSAFSGEGYPQREPQRMPAEVTLALTERSILVVPPPGAAGVRIPYEAVLDVAPSAKSSSVVIVTSVCGRFDIFTFILKQEQSQRSSEIAKAAITLLKARVAAAQTATRN